MSGIVSKNYRSLTIDMNPYSMKLNQKKNSDFDILRFSKSANQNHNNINFTFFPSDLDRSDKYLKISLKLPVLDHLLISSSRPYW